MQKKPNEGVSIMKCKRNFVEKVLKEKDYEEERQCTSGRTTVNWIARKSNIIM
jgi:hypothetical protein